MPNLPELPIPPSTAPARNKSPDRREQSAGRTELTFCCIDRVFRSVMYSNEGIANANVIVANPNGVTV